MALPLSRPPRRRRAFARLVGVTLACLVSTAAPALAAAPSTGLSPHPLYQDGATGRLLLEGNWAYRLDPTNRGLGAHFERDRRSAGWRRVHVPFNWNAKDSQADAPSIGWFRATFIAPAAGRWNVRFESVTGKATVWLNGRRLGTHEGAYLPFELRALGLRKGRNRLVVRTDTNHTAKDLTFWRTDPTSGQARYGWWNFGGISREVYLRHIDRLDISRIAAVPTVSCLPSCTASLRVSTTLTSASGTARRASLKLRVGAKLISFHSRRLAPGRSLVLSTSIPIDRPRLWSPEHPSLYPVRARAYVDDRASRGRPVAGSDLHVGLRTIRRDAATGRLFLNDRPLLLHGASYHEDTRNAGSAWGPAQWNTISSDLRSLHANVTRAHYPMHPAMLERFDREGVLVWDEIPVYQTPNSTWADPARRALGVSWARAMAERDLNHASVFTYSVANELPAVIDAGQSAFLGAAIDAVHAADPTRFVAIDRYVDGKVQAYDVLRRFDLHGLNEYFGWYGGAVSDTGPYLDRYHAAYPGQGLVVTEVGAEANRDGDQTQKGTYQFQQQFLRQQMATFAQRPYLAGALVWALRDFRVQPYWTGGNPHPTPPWNMKGLIDRFFGPKPAFYEVRGIYAGVRDGQWPAGLAASAPLAPRRTSSLSPANRVFGPSR